MRAAGKTAEEQYQLILECRRSGMSDCDWCREKGIKLDTCACYKRLDGSIQGRFRWPHLETIRLAHVRSGARAAQGTEKGHIKSGSPPKRQKARSLSCFSRKASFRWFVTITIGLMLSDEFFVFGL